MKFLTTVAALAAAAAALPSIERRTSFRSNELELEVDGFGPAAPHLRDKRFVPQQSTCSNERWEIFKEALRAAHYLSRRAREAALNGPADKMNNYFKSDSKETREAVANVFGRLVAELESRGNRTVYTCDDKRCIRQSPALAQRLDDEAYLLSACPLLFTMPIVSPPNNSSFSMAGVLIYELTELPYIGATENLNKVEDTVPRFEELIRGLSHEDSMKFAASYSFFANSVYLDRPDLRVTDTQKLAEREKEGEKRN